MALPNMRAIVLGKEMESLWFERGSGEEGARLPTVQTVGPKAWTSPN